MNSNKAKRAELKVYRAEKTKIRAQQTKNANDTKFVRQFLDLHQTAAKRSELHALAVQQGYLSEGAISVVPANQHVLRTRNGADIPLPKYYCDWRFRCRKCGTEETWTAKQQRWWYEEAFGSIRDCPVECHACRRSREEIKRNDYLHVMTAHLKSLAQKPPTEESRVEVISALKSKWTGVRVVAICVIGAWWNLSREEQDLQRLKYWIEGDDGVSDSWDNLASRVAKKSLGVIQ